MPVGVDRPHAAAQHGKRATADLQRGVVSHTVDTERQPRHDRHAGAGEVGGDAARHVLAVGSRALGTDDRNRAAVGEANIAAQEDHRRWRRYLAKQVGVGVMAQRQDVDGIPAQQLEFTLRIAAIPGDGKLFQRASIQESAQLLLVGVPGFAHGAERGQQPLEAHWTDPVHIAERGPVRRVLIRLVGDRSDFTRLGHHARPFLPNALRRVTWRGIYR
ncbi:MAG TPA: hypothetical protein VGR22_12480 [Thermomicrobiales bacterium]|nr:hypothetical protein [Thermomicrobiales bacterium]